MPFIIVWPQTCVELTCPYRSTSRAVFMAITPSCRTPPGCSRSPAAAARSAGRRSRGRRPGRCICSGGRVSAQVLAPSSRPRRISSKQRAWNTSVYIRKSGMSGLAPSPARTALAMLPTPTLQRQELRRDPAGGHLLEQEPRRRDRRCARLTASGGVEAAQLVGLVGLDDADHLLRIDPGVGLADPLQRMVEVEGGAVGRRLGDDDVGHLAEPRASGSG